MTIEEVWCCMAPGEFNRALMKWCKHFESAPRTVKEKVCEWVHLSAPCLYKWLISLSIVCAHKNSKNEKHSNNRKREVKDHCSRKCCCQQLKPIVTTDKLFKILKMCYNREAVAFKLPTGWWGHSNPIQCFCYTHFAKEILFSFHFLHWTEI